MTSEKINLYRKNSLTAGALYLLTFVSIPTLALYKTVKEPGYVLGGGPDTAALTGGLLEIVVALACIGSAVALYPVLRKQSQPLAIGLVASRVLEASLIFIGVAMILTIVALRVQGAADAPLMAGQLLGIMYDKIFLVSQSFLPAINDLILGILLYKSQLVPKPLAMIGIVGAFPLVVGLIAVVYGVIPQGGDMAGLAALLVALFELSLGFWLVFKGFNQAAAKKLSQKK
ncbi:TPA: DUF4386 domain-containing protein [Candidatus Saccharibacteria bacterium]|nr:DUF4386 domain-containing protein [Candidatus Saccharibacteria bacterium]HRF28080.1 DUF4386 domain-containing protein [Candidatus Saccharibacteria bacterium]HRJ91306.1 DUF4386 domain-containing protein [Candidatus Saccharibacteria bacterium]